MPVFRCHPHALPARACSGQILFGVTITSSVRFIVARYGALRVSPLPLQSARMSVSLFFALYCLEAGLFFIVAPWTRLWSVNPILHATPALMMLSVNPFVRGFISGFGVAHLLIGIKD